MGNNSSKLLWAGNQCSQAASWLEENFFRNKTKSKMLINYLNMVNTQASAAVSVCMSECVCGLMSVLDPLSDFILKHDIMRTRTRLFGKWGHFGRSSQLYHSILGWRLQFRGKLWILVRLKLGLGCIREWKMSSPRCVWWRVLTCIRCCNPLALSVSVVNSFCICSAQSLILQNTKKID